MLVVLYALYFVLVNNKLVHAFDIIFMSVLGNRECLTKIPDNN